MIQIRNSDPRSLGSHLVHLRKAKELINPYPEDSSAPLMNYDSSDLADPDLDRAKVMHARTLSDLLNVQKILAGLPVTFHIHSTLDIVGCLQSDWEIYRTLEVHSRTLRRLLFIY